MSTLHHAHCDLCGAEELLTTSKQLPFKWFQVTVTPNAAPSSEKTFDVCSGCLTYPATEQSLLEIIREAWSKRFHKV